MKSLVKLSFAVFGLIMSAFAVIFLLILIVSAGTDEEATYGG